jgi:hypothetical protein
MARAAIKEKTVTNRFRALVRAKVPDSMVVKNESFDAKIDPIWDGKFIVEYVINGMYNGNESELVSNIKKFFNDNGADLVTIRKAEFY